MWLPSSPFLPCVRTPGGPPAGACTARALFGHGRVVRPAPSRRCLPTLPLCPRGGGRFSPPPTCIPHPRGGGGVGGGGGAPLSSSLRSTHVAGTTQAWRRHEARHLSLCRGGGPAVSHPWSPLLPCVRTPGGAEVCGGGGALVVVPSLHTCRRHDASTTQARGAALGCSGGGGGVLLWAFQPSSTVGAPHPRISSRRCPLAVVARTRTAHDMTHGNYPLPCPLCSLPRPQCSHGAEQCPCLPRRSLSLLPLSGLRSPPKCPTSFALPVPSSLVLAGPRCLSLRRHTAHCTFGGGLPCGSTPRHPALPRAPARRGRLTRLWGTMLPPSLPCHLRPSALRLARAQCGAIREAALPLCPPLCPGPPALSCPLSARPPSPCPAPRPWLLGLRPPVSLSPSSLYSLGVHRAEQCARQPSHSLSPLLPPGVLSSRFVARTLYRTRYLRGHAA